jgi:hypothetical protein
MNLQERSEKIVIRKPNSLFYSLFPNCSFIVCAEVTRTNNRIKEQVTWNLYGVAVSSALNKAADRANMRQK